MLPFLSKGKSAFYIEVVPEYIFRPGPNWRRRAMLGPTEDELIDELRGSYDLIPGVMTAVPLLLGCERYCFPAQSARFSRMEPCTDLRCYSTAQSRGGRHRQPCLLRGRSGP